MKSATMESATNPARMWWRATTEAGHDLALPGTSSASLASFIIAATAEMISDVISQSPRFDGAVALKEEGDARAYPQYDS